MPVPAGDGQAVPREGTQGRAPAWGVGAGDTGWGLPCLPTLLPPRRLLQLRPHSSALSRSCLPSPSESTSPGPGEGSLQNCLAGYLGAPAGAPRGQAPPTRPWASIYSPWPGATRCSAGLTLHVGATVQHLSTLGPGRRVTFPALWKVLQEPGGWMVSPRHQGNPVGPRSLTCSVPF